MIFFSPSCSKNSSNLVASSVRLGSSRTSEAQALKENSTPRGHCRVWGFFPSRDGTFDTKSIIQVLSLGLTRDRDSVPKNLAVTR